MPPAARLHPNKDYYEAVYGTTMESDDQAATPPSSSSQGEEGDRPAALMCTDNVTTLSVGKVGRESASDEPVAESVMRTRVIGDDGREFIFRNTIIKSPAGKDGVITVESATEESSLPGNGCSKPAESSFQKTGSASNYEVIESPSSFPLPAATSAGGSSKETPPPDSDVELVSVQRSAKSTTPAAVSTAKTKGPTPAPIGL